MELGSIINDDRDHMTEDKKMYLPNGWQRTKWIPLAARANGSILFIDCDPAINGTVGQVCFNDSEGGYEVLSDGLENFLNQAVFSEI